VPNNTPTIPASAGGGRNGTFDVSQATTPQKIVAGGGDDIVLGGSGDDRINAGGGNDIVWGGAGNDTIKAGGNNNTALYSGSVTDFSWATAQNGTITVTDLNKADGDEGTDTLSGFSTIQFNDFTLNMKGQNAAHVVADRQVGNEDGALDFSVNAYDYDGDIPVIQSISVTGAGSISTVGETSIASGKTFGLRFEPGSAYQSLAMGETATETVTMVVSDGQGNLTTKSFDIVIEGRNDGPVATGVTYGAGALKEDTVSVVAGQVEATDIDTSDALGFNVPTGNTGTYGQLTLDAQTGAWSYALDNSLQAVQNLNDGDVVTETFQVQVSDGNGGFAMTTISLDIAGTNDAPPVILTARNDFYHAAEGVTLELNGHGVLCNDTSSEAGTAMIVNAVEGVAANVGQSVTLSSGAIVTLLEDGSFSYDGNGKFASLASGQVATDSFTYAVTDAYGTIEQATATITIHGQDEFENSFTIQAGDTYFGGAMGNTHVIGSEGNEPLWGDAGNVRVSQPGEAYGTFYRDHADAQAGVVHWDTMPNFGNDLIEGGNGNDQATGDAPWFYFRWTDTGDQQMGDDILLGGAGNDRLHGDSELVRMGYDGDATGTELRMGNDYLNGGDGDDYIYGDISWMEGDTALVDNRMIAGDDIIEGGRGNDSLWGDGPSAWTQTGADVFIFGCHSGHDVINDFEVGQDRIDLKAYGYIDIADLSITQNGNTAVIDLDGPEAWENSLTVIMDTNAGLTNADFLFA
jgi:VCBS repeat-containing protein